MIKGPDIATFYECESVGRVWLWLTISVMKYLMTLIAFNN